MNQESFDASYIERLRAGDPAAENHFVAYFGRLLWLKLRHNLKSPQVIEEARQETFLRLFRYFRSGKTLEHPERLPGFVHSVCHNVALEFVRSEGRHSPMPENQPDPPDERIDPNEGLISEERKAIVARILSELPERDREMLRMLFLEEAEREEICRRYDVTAGYLRVVLHRAKIRFRQALESGKTRQAVG